MTLGQFIDNLKLLLHEEEDLIPSNRGWNDAIGLVIERLNQYDKSIDLISEPEVSKLDLIIENQRLEETVTELEIAVKILAQQYAESLNEDFAKC